MNRHVPFCIIREFLGRNGRRESFLKLQSLCAVLGAGILASSLQALEKDKSSREFKVSFENKSYLGRDRVYREIDRLNLETNYKFQLNRKNNLSIQLPYSYARLSAQNGQLDTLSGIKDAVITHTMETRKPKPGLFGVKWAFKLGLPLGKEQLSAGEDRVYQAMNETGQGLDKAPLGAGFNLGFDLTLNRIYNPNRNVEYVMGYTVQGNYSTLEDQLSRKEPGDNIRLGFKNTLKKGKSHTYQYGLTANYTDKTSSSRSQAGVPIISKLPSKVEYTMLLRSEVMRTANLKQIIHFEYQQKDLFESLSSDGKFIKTDQGDRIKLDWLFEHKLNARVSQKFGVTSLFGEPNKNVEASGPAPVPPLGKDFNSRIEDIQANYGRIYTLNKYRKWYWNVSRGLTEDSRDYVLEAGLNFTF